MFTLPLTVSIHVMELLLVFLFVLYVLFVASCLRAEAATVLWGRVREGPGVSISEGNETKDSRREEL